ncbi:uncharacterized protein LOC113558242 [Rhopalosiphum maidis]|uniref:uncharacterized protein LOC113558242 n=1 Tax=Rhopalosiphum maidis TaxID=43146 RepID=UPI000F005676|nr:uncharacterized protein LOC113558242 [Rhopalosiphum maidis]
MDIIKRKTSAGLKKTNNLSNLEAHFIGFDVDDKVLIRIENKKKLLKMELKKETSEPMEVDEPTDSPSIGHNNHINKKKLSKSRKPNGIKNNWSNKRHKKDNIRNDTLESFKLHVPPSLVLTTPKFNITSSNTRILRSAGRKMNYDIRDAIFKLPFKHGWKREIVYRSSVESGVVTRANRSGDVYYYSPNGQKLKSLRDIKEQLDISSDKTSLTIESFTFVTKPIGINDKSKELDDTTVGVAVKPKKSKTPKQRPPFDSELTGDGNKKSVSKPRLDLKRAKTSTTSKSNKELNTSTFNYTYIEPPKNRMPYGAGRNINCLITDSIFKLPFEHGWKRELVYRTSSESAVVTEDNRSGDIYYYSPSGQKLRSLQEIQEYLNISFDKTTLTIDNFTFLAKPIFVYDESKERIRDADFKLYKNETTDDIAVLLQKSITPEQRTPLYYGLTFDVNKKSACQMRHFLNM